MLNRRRFTSLALSLPAIVIATSWGEALCAGTGSDGVDPLPSWNEGAAKAAIVRFVRAAIDPASPGFVAEEDRIAAFDQDGTLWVEHPIYTQVEFAFARVAALAPLHPQWR